MDNSTDGGIVKSMNTNGILTLAWDDVGKGLVMAVLGGALTTLYQMFTAHTGIDWSIVLQASELAGVAYLVKNFFSDYQGKFLGHIG